VIKTADWIVDLGPEGGSGGGRILVAGTPEEVAATPASHTGRFLAPHLKATAAAAPKKTAKREKNALKHIASADKHKPMPRRKKTP
jgi:excinuclease ABC subunit A